MINRGFFLITDITGYTTFLSHSELDHAQHIIEALFESQLASIEPPVIVSNFQGDAILCYIPEESLEHGKIVYDQVRAIYAAFTNKMAEMQIDPPCSCSACSGINTLDLKIFVHYGDYLVKRMGKRDEILGSDVILAHRMMKNNVKERLGFASYLLITDSAFRRLELPDTGFQMINHVQSFESTGEVRMLVASLK